MIDAASRALMSGLIALSIGCAGGQGDPPSRTQFEDPEGNPLVLDSLPATRIVSTLQSATEWLVLLGAADHLVARTDYDRQAVLAHLPSIGGGLETSPEAILELAPDLVIGWRIRASADLARALAPFDIPVIALEATDTAQIFWQLHLLGQLVGAEPRADSLATALRLDLARSAAACELRDSLPTVMPILSITPAMTAGQGTWISELLPAACLQNAFADLDTAWPTISLEVIVQRNPQWLLISRGAAPGDRLAELRALPGWRDLPAVQAGRVLEIDGDLFARAGPTVADWVAAVAREITRLSSPTPERWPSG